MNHHLRRKSLKTWNHHLRRDESFDDVMNHLRRDESFDDVMNHLRRDKSRLYVVYMFVISVPPSKYIFIPD